MAPSALLEASFDVWVKTLEETKRKLAPNLNVAPQ